MKCTESGYKYTHAQPESTNDSGFFVCVAYKNGLKIQQLENTSCFV